MPRTRGLHGPIEDNVIDWRVMRAAILKDGRIDDAEARQLLHFHDARNRTDTRVARTLRRVNAALGSEQGDEGVSFLRLVHEREAPGAA